MLKQMASIIFALIYSLCKFFPIKENKVFFIMTHDLNFTGNLKSVYDELLKNKTDYKIYILSKNDYDIPLRFRSVKKVTSLFFCKAYHLATSSVVLLNNIFIPSAFFSFRKNTEVIQMWHAVGTFKKFGEDYRPSLFLDFLQRKANNNYTNVIVNSTKDIEIYSKAFGVEASKVLALGNPSCDLFFNKKRIKESKLTVSKFLSIECDRKVILYAPTFRENFKDNNFVIEHLNHLASQLNEEYLVLVKLHPQMFKKIDIFSENYQNILDVSSCQNINELMLVSDLLITDYSSLIYEYVLTGNPIIFVAQDLEEYSKKRGFYHEYESFVPGSIYYNIKDAIEAINNDGFANRSQDFANKWHEYFDGQSTKRVINKFF